METPSNRPSVTKSTISIVLAVAAVVALIWFGYDLGKDDATAPTPTKEAQVERQREMLEKLCDPEYTARVTAGNDAIGDAVMENFSTSEHRAVSAALRETTTKPPWDVTVLEPAIRELQDQVGSSDPEDGPVCERLATAQP